jgi:hypothetical protein
MNPKFELTDKQAEALKVMGCGARHVQLEGGSRSGKTLLFLYAAAIRSLRAPGARHAVLRWRFNHVKQSVVFDTWPKLMEIAFPNEKVHLNKSDWFAEFENGSQVWFGGLDDSDKILGNEYCGILLNEASQIGWDARNRALTRLAQKVEIHEDGKPTGNYLPLRMWDDLNPGMDTHWTGQVFHKHRDPETKKPLGQMDQYASFRLNPSDNLDNLPESYIDTLNELPARLRKRFLYGEYADANADSYFDSVVFDKWRDLSSTVDMQRIVIAVDPSGSDDEDSDNDAIGIAVCGMGTDGNGYLLEDLTVKGGPAKWGLVVATAYENHGADMVVGEVNYGGAMVEHVIQSARPPELPPMPYTKVTATRGKVVRAEPISALVERGKIRHIGHFPALEDELCGFTSKGYTGSGSPNRADAYVWGFSYLFPGLVKHDKPKVPQRRNREHLQSGTGWMGA